MTCPHNHVPDNPTTSFISLFSPRFPTSRSSPTSLLLPRAPSSSPILPIHFPSRSLPKFLSHVTCIHPFFPLFPPSFPQPWWVVRGGGGVCWRRRTDGTNQRSKLGVLSGTEHYACDEEPDNAMQLTPPSKQIHEEKTPGKIKRLEEDD